MQPQRGSAKLGASAESLTRALTTAQSDYRVERWWKYGQPAFELIKAELNVTNAASTGKIVQELVSLTRAGLRVNVEVFPYGIINPEGARINVAIEEEVARKTQPTVSSAPFSGPCLRAALCARANLPGRFGACRKKADFYELLGTEWRGISCGAVASSPALQPEVPPLLFLFRAAQH